VKDNTSNTEDFNLANPPIVLAIAQIRYELPKDFEVDSFLLHKPSIDRDYPEFRTNVSGQIKIQDIIEGKKMAALQDSKKNGFLFISKDNTRSFSIELDKFTFNDKGKYTSREIFFGNVIKAWRNFEQIFNDVVIKGISLRFINEISINDKIEDPLEYFNYTIFAEDAAHLNEIESYFINFNYHWGENKFTHLSHNLRIIGDNKNSATIDIDVHNKNVIEIYDEPTIIKVFEELKTEINSRFFNSISTKLKKQLS
jgi:uncharacterized protein (TIGR04255 family)